MEDWKDIESSSNNSPSGVDDTSKELPEPTPEKNNPTEQLAKVQSTSRRSDIDPLAEPPDGGLNAWLKVVGCFLIYSNIWCVSARTFDMSLL